LQVVDKIMTLGLYNPHHFLQMFNMELLHFNHPLLAGITHQDAGYYHSQAYCHHDAKKEKEQQGLEFILTWNRKISAETVKTHGYKQYT